MEWDWPLTWGHPSAARGAGAGWPLTPFCWTAASVPWRWYRRRRRPRRLRRPTGRPSKSRRLRRSNPGHMAKIKRSRVNQFQRSVGILQESHRRSRDLTNKSRRIPKVLKIEVFKTFSRIPGPSEKIPRKPQRILGNSKRIPKIIKGSLDILIRSQDPSMGSSDFLEGSQGLPKKDPKSRWRLV